MPARPIAFMVGLTAAVAAVPASAQVTGTDRWADSVRREIEVASSAGDERRLAAAVALAERALAVTPNEPWLVYYRALGLYRSAGVQLGQQRTKEAKQGLDEADRILEALNDRQPSTEALALHGAVLGQLIAVSGSQMIAGMRLGPKSGRLVDRAMELAPDNPRVWLIRGQSALHTPAMFGGGVDKALRDFRRSIELFATPTSPPPPLPDWGRVDAYIWLGQALERGENWEEAKAAYLEALELSPAHPWVTQVLLPQLERRTSSP